MYKRQMLLYPPKHNKNPKNNVITVEKYLFVNNFLTPVRSEPSAASPMKMCIRDSNKTSQKHGGSDFHKVRLHKNSNHSILDKVSLDHTVYRH